MYVFISAIYTFNMKNQSRFPFEKRLSETGSAASGNDSTSADNYNTGPMGTPSQAAAHSADIPVARSRLGEHVPPSH